MKYALAKVCLLFLWLSCGAYGQAAPAPAESRTPSTREAQAPASTLSKTEPAESLESNIDLPLVDLVKSIPELRGLQPAADQQELPTLLEKVGDKAHALFQKMPNLIAHEEVVQQTGRSKPFRQAFEYLILSHTTEKEVRLDEYRVDLDKAPALDETYNPSAVQSGASPFVDLERLSREASTHNKGALPLSQGFANGWVYFYPSNRSQSRFRFLGRQSIQGHSYLVIAFAQVPAAVQSPGLLQFEDQTLPIYYQGIAWVDESDLHIVHLRTDLLAPMPIVHLQTLTADIYYGETQVAESPPLWLPQKVLIRVDTSGQIFRETHDYSHYRAYVVKTRLIF